MQSLVFQRTRLLLHPLVQLMQPPDQPAYCHHNGSTYKESALEQFVPDCLPDKIKKK